MIIGKDKLTNNNAFATRDINNNNNINIPKPLENKPTTNFKNVFTKEISQYKYSNPSNTNDMRDKALASLNDRLSKGTITMDEFQKQCANLNKNK